VDRPSLQKIYMDHAMDWSQRSTCLRGTKVGAVITDIRGKYSFGVGYNGNAAGLKNGCDLTGPEAVGKCGCVHAEENAAIHCGQPWWVEKILYSTHLPCAACAKRLINLGGVRQVFFLNDYRIRDSLLLFMEVGIEVGHYVEGRPRSEMLYAGQELTKLALQAKRDREAAP
jgi:dCMP deaminase